MNNINGKVFRKIANNNNNNIELVVKEYNQGENYYEFLRNNKKDGLNQIIITSDIMISIIEHYVVEREFNIISIDFIIEDESLNEDINEYMKMIKEDKLKVVYLLKHLNFLTQDESIDLKAIKLKGVCHEKEKSFILSIKVNGIFTIREDLFIIESTYLVNLLNGMINEND